MLLSKLSLDGTIEHLVVVSDPRTLGEMRKHFHRDLRGKIIGELAKDFSRRPLEDIASLIADVTHNGRVVYDGFLLRTGWPHPGSSAARPLTKRGVSLRARYRRLRRRSSKSTSSVSRSSTAAMHERFP